MATMRPTMDYVVRTIHNTRDEGMGGGHELQHSKEPDKKRFPSRKIPGVFFPGGQTQYSTTHKNVAFIDVEKCWDVCMSYFNILRRKKNNIEWGILSSSIIFVRLRRNHFSVEKNNF